MIKKQISLLLLAILLQALFFIYPLSGNSGFLFNLFLFCPLPLYFLGILFGYKYVIFASIPAILIIYTYGFNIAVSYSLFFALPCVYLSYYIGLSKIFRYQDYDDFLNDKSIIKNNKIFGFL